MDRTQLDGDLKNMEARAVEKDKRVMAEVLQKFGSDEKLHRKIQEGKYNLGALIAEHSGASYNSLANLYWMFKQRNTVPNLEEIFKDPKAWTSIETEILFKKP